MRYRTAAQKTPRNSNMYAFGSLPPTRCVRISYSEYAAVVCIADQPVYSPLIANNKAFEGGHNSWTSPK